MVTLESILRPGNLAQALEQVVENGGSPGMDGMSVFDLQDHIIQNGARLVEDIREGRYKPQPVRRVYIDKDGGGPEKRPLGIPTVYDRYVQQAVAQELVREFDPIFHPNSHGFRPGRGCHSAMKSLLEYVNDGYEWVVDLDLRKFFDTVNHSKLIQVLSDRIKDGRVISLIHKMLMAPILEDGKLHPCNMGTPQGGNISPVLSNILLNELDWELDRRGHKFIRYADDCMVLCGSRKAAERTLDSIRKFLERKLFLQLNEEKTRICRITNPDLKYLGFGLWRNPKTGEVALRPHQKSKARCIARLKELTSRNRGISLDDYRRSLQQFVRGWVGYFRISDMKSFVLATDRWLRRRIRQIYWKIWKRVRTRYRGLQLCGIKKDQAWQWANSRKKYWRIACSFVLHLAFKNAFLRKLGWTCLGDVYFRSPANC